MARLEKADWVRGALQTVARDGIDGLRVERLAAGLGVTKGSFYWHFDSRRELLDATLTWWESSATDNIIKTVDAAADDGAGRFHALTELVFVAEEEYDALEASLRAWAVNDPAARDVVDRVDRRRLDYVTDLLTSAGVDAAKAEHRAAFLYRALIGDYLWRSMGGEPLAAAAISEFETMALDPD